MNETVRKVLDNLVPQLLELRALTHVLLVVYWLATAFLALLFVGTQPVFGAVVMAPPVVLIVATRVVGLSTVDDWVRWLGLAAALVPAFFLGRYQRGEDAMVGLEVVGFIGFLVWVAGFPLVVDLYDRLHELAKYPKEVRPRTLRTEDRDPESTRLVLVVKLAMATAALVVVGGTYDVVLSVAALVYPTRWTARAALVAALLGGFLDAKALTWGVDWLGVVAGVLAATLWWQALRHPLWDRGTRRVRT